MSPRRLRPILLRLVLFLVVGGVVLGGNALRLRMAEAAQAIPPDAYAADGTDTPRSGPRLIPGAMFDRLARFIDDMSLSQETPPGWGSGDEDFEDADPAVRIRAGDAPEAVVLAPATPEMDVPVSQTPVPAPAPL